MQLIPV